MATLFPLPKFQAFDTNGNPLSGGKLYTYSAGTTTPQVTYTDQGGGTPNANPVVLDTRGEADVWLDPALVYKLVLADSADVTIWTVDQVNKANSSSDWSFLQAGAGAVTRTAQAKMRDVVSVKDFGAVGDGAADDTAAIQAAIDSFATGNGVVIFPKGTYKTTSTLTISQHRIHLVGDGRWVTVIVFAPTANDTAIEFSKGALVLYQCSLSGMTFSSSDTTYEKLALDAVDVSAFTVRDVVVGPEWNGGASKSIGIRCRGREASRFDGIELYCDRPLVIATNPNATLDIDHFHFSNLYIQVPAASANPCVEIQTGVGLSQVTFDGFQAWVGGAGGLYWIDTTSTGTSQGLVLNNVRYEQASDATKYFVRIEHNQGLQQFTVRGGQAGICRGIYLREVKWVTLAEFLYTDSSREALNADATCYPIDIRNCLWNTGSTATITGLSVYHKGPTLTSMPLPEIGLLSATGASGANYDEQINTTIASPSAIVANNAKLLIGGANQAGFVLIYTSADVSAIYELKGSSAAVAEIADSNGWFSPASGGGNFEVGWDGTNYYVENKTGSDKNIRVMRIGKAE